MKITDLDLQLSSATDTDLREVLTWFDCAKELLYWGGPDLTFPPELESFKQQSRYHKSHSFVLHTSTEVVVAFGQFYNRLNHCHLGRLAVAPTHRGQGIGAVLIERLNQRGKKDLGLQSGSLFVLNDNAPAMHLYQKLGYQQAQYPKTIPLEKCLYMIKKIL